MIETLKKTLKYLPIIIITFLLYKIINQPGLIGGVFSSIYRILVPFIWALTIAYLLNPVMSKFEKKYKLSRRLSLVLTYLVGFVIIIGLLLIIIPSLIESITDIVSELPTYGEKVSDWYQSKLASIKSVQEFTEAYNIDIEKATIGKIKEEATAFTNNLQEYVMAFGKFVFNFTSGFMNFFIGFVVSIFFLRDKEKFEEGLTKLSRSILGDKITDRIHKTMLIIDGVFSKYIIGKALDSFIIGIICFIGLLVLRVKYAGLFSIIIGVLNMIPYFGPFIGAVPAIVITLIIDPFKALGVVIFIFILQQLDGNVIGPRIIGGSVGISSFWVITSIIIGGQLFGVVGMLLGVPVVTVLRMISIDKMDSVLSERDAIKEYKQEE